MKLPTWTMLLCLALLPASAARAHEFWIEPSTFSAGRGDSVLTRVFVGTGFRGEIKPYASSRTVTWLVRETKLVDLRPTSVNADEIFARWKAGDGGGLLFAYESNFASIELPAEEFDRYLELEGLDEPRAARARLGAGAGEGRERYARCPKTWIAGRDPKRVTAPVGLSIELVPRTDPARPGPLDLELLFRGQPLQGALVRAWRQPLASAWSGHDAATRDSVGPVSQARTDARGHATLTLPRGGEWLVSAVHMEPSRDPRHADWESYWASLTFARPERKP